MTYINAFRVQKYINDESIYLDIPTYSLLFKRKYYRKYYNKLKRMSNVSYIGMAADNNLKSAIDFILYFTDQSKVISNLEIDIYRKLRDMQLLDEYDSFNAEDFYSLCQKILISSEQLQCFTERKYVTEICENVLKEKKEKRDNGFFENRLVIIVKGE
jgi:hypothetical protein